MFTKKRSDGAYIRDLPYFTRLMPYLMPKRSEACIYFEQDFDVTKALEYVRAANADCPPGQKRLTLFQIFLCATARTLAPRPSSIASSPATAITSATRSSSISWGASSAFMTLQELESARAEATL